MHSLRVGGASKYQEPRRGPCISQAEPLLRFRKNSYEGSRDPARPPFGLRHPRAGFSSARRARRKVSGAAMAATGQKGLPVIVLNIRLYAGITLRWLYFCKRKGKATMKRALLTIPNVGTLAP